MTSSNDDTDILERLKNTNSNTYSTGELIRMAIVEIERLREQVSVLEARYQGLSGKLVEALKIRGPGDRHV